MWPRPSPRHRNLTPATSTESPLSAYAYAGQGWTGLLDHQGKARLAAADLAAQALPDYGARPASMIARSSASACFLLSDAPPHRRGIMPWPTITCQPTASSGKNCQPRCSRGRAGQAWPQRGPGVEAASGRLTKVSIAEGLAPTGSRRRPPPGRSLPGPVWQHRADCAHRTGDLVHIGNASRSFAGHLVHLLRYTTHRTGHLLHVDVDVGNRRPHVLHVSAQVGHDPGHRPGYSAVIGVCAGYAGRSASTLGDQVMSHDRPATGCDTSNPYCRRRRSGPGTAR